MKHQTSLVFSLLAAGSLIVGSAQAQEKLFSAQMGNKLVGDEENYYFNGDIAPLGSQKEIIGFLIRTSQSTYSNNGGESRTEPALKIFAPDGRMLKDLTYIFTKNTYDYVDEINQFENGSFSISLLNDDSYGQTVFFSYTGTDWIETSRVQESFDNKVGIQDVSISDGDVGRPSAIAFFKIEGNAVIADVYTTNKEALAPAPKITSDLSDLSLRKSKLMAVYSITANFETTGFTAIGVPPGLVFNSGNGQLSGRPTSKGYFSVVIGASRRGQAPVFATLNLRVR